MLLYCCALERPVPFAVTDSPSFILLLVSPVYQRIFRFFSIFDRLVQVQESLVPVPPPLFSIFYTMQQRAGLRKCLGFFWLHHLCSSLPVLCLLPWFPLPHC